MNVKKCIDILMARLGNRKAPGLRSSILMEMVFVQEQELEQAPELPWFIISEATQGPGLIIPGERRVRLPLDFLREVEGAPLEWVDEDGEGHEIRKGDYDVLEAEFNTLGEGAPSAYDFRGDYIVVFPLPDENYTIRFPEGYYARQAVPEDSESSENAWFKNAADLMIAMTGKRVSTFIIKDAELVAAYTTDQQRAENRLVRVMTAREEANRDRQMNPTPR